MRELSRTVSRRRESRRSLHVEELLLGRSLCLDHDLLLAPLRLRLDLDRAHRLSGRLPLRLRTRELGLGHRALLLGPRDRLLPLPLGHVDRLLLLALRDLDRLLLLDRGELERARRLDLLLPRLAVLPLAPDAPGDNDRALATRLTEGITAALVRADGLAIVSSTSAARFDREPRDVREVAQALDADWLVEGSVFVDGDRVRVAARLVDPSRNQKVWAEDFEGEMAALRDLEQQVAKGVDEAARSRRRD